jgi:Neutral/alkaline non-lysosomal ceramidase, N-terminal
MMKGFVLLLCLFAAFPVDAGAGQLRVGAAAVPITPPAGAPLAGYYYKRVSDGVLDDLYSKAVVIERDGLKAAIVILDLVSLPRAVVEAARKEIEAQTGITGANVMIGATHTHTSPVVSDKRTRDVLDGGDTEPALRYTAGLPALIAQSVVEADKRLAPARGSAAIAREEEVSFNRRFWMRDGSVSWNPPKLDKNIIRPAGPIDPEIGFLYFETPDEKPITTIVNFALHADTVGGTRVSADYAGQLSRLLGEYKGREMLTLFALGACGNINHRDVFWRDKQKGINEAFRIGSVLAGAINRSWDDLKPFDSGAVQVRSELVRLPLAQIMDSDVAQANEVLKRVNDPQTKFMEQVKTFQVFDVQARQGRPLEVEVQVITIGRDVAFVSLPGEVFVELGISIKKASPFPHTMIVELANGSIGYIPNKSAYPEGNYEVVSARCAAGSGEMLVTAAAKLLGAMFESAK